MRPIKDKIVINIEVTPDEVWSKAIDEDGNRKGLSRLIAKELINQIKRRIEYYLEDHLDDDEEEIVRETSAEIGIEDNYSEFDELVKEVDITWK